MGSWLDGRGYFYFLQGYFKDPLNGVFKTSSVGRGGP